jgi:hypothetical protein
MYQLNRISIVSPIHDVITLAKSQLDDTPFVTALSSISSFPPEAFDEHAASSSSDTFSMAAGKQDNHLNFFEF